MIKENFTCFQEAINEIEFDILDSGYLYADKTWRHSNISSPFCRLYFITRGEGTIEYEGDRIRLLPGFAYIIPLHTECSYICADYMEKFYIHFNMKLFSGSDIFENIHECISGLYDKNAFEIFIMKAKSQDIHDSIYCKAFLMNTVYGLAVQHLPKVVFNAELYYKYRQLYNIIKNNCNAQTDLKYLSSAMCMTIPTLSRNFKRDTGQTLKKYLTGKLLRRAKELLLTSERSIKELAYELKFRDEFYFSRFIKKHTGMPPSKYRSKNRFK